MTYPYVQSYYHSLGARKGGTLGLMYHMAEGGGTVSYLDANGNPPNRGVSVHAVCEYSGRVVQMLPWGDASGSLNPADRSGDDAYYGHSHLVDVLGTWWKDPNSAVLSMEIEGFAKDGPNAAQVAGASAWGLDMRARFPSLRGALGHTDQTDTKGCPGLSTAMKQIFTNVGGHGLFVPMAPPTDTAGEPPMATITLVPTPTLVLVKQYAVLYDNSAFAASAGNVTVSGQREMPLIGNIDPQVARLVDLTGPDGIPTGKGYWLKWGDIAGMRPVPQTPTDCAAAVATATEPLTAQLASTQAALTTATTNLANATGAERDRIALAEAARIRAL